MLLVKNEMKYLRPAHAFSLSVDLLTAIRSVQGAPTIPDSSQILLRFNVNELPPWLQSILGSKPSETSTPGSGPGPVSNPGSASGGTGAGSSGATGSDGSSQVPGIYWIFVVDFYRLSYLTSINHWAHHRTNPLALHYGGGGVDWVSFHFLTSTVARVQCI